MCISCAFINSLTTLVLKTSNRWPQGCKAPSPEHLNLLRPVLRPSVEGLGVSVIMIVGCSLISLMNTVMGVNRGSGLITNESR